MIQKPGSLESVAEELVTPDLGKLLDDVLQTKVPSILETPRRVVSRYDLKNARDRKGFVQCVIRGSRSRHSHGEIPAKLATLIGAAAVLKRCSGELTQLLSGRPELEQKELVSYALDRVRMATLEGHEEVADFLTHLAEYSKTLSPSQIAWLSETVEKDHYVDDDDGGWGSGGMPDGALIRMGKRSYPAKLVNTFPAELGWERIEKCLTLVNGDEEEFQPMSYAELCAYAEENAYGKDVARFIDERIFELKDGHYQYIYSTNKNPNRLSPTLKAPGSFPKEPRNLVEKEAEIDENLSREMEKWTFEGMKETSHMDWENMLKRLRSKKVDINVAFAKARALLEGISIDDFKAAFASPQAAVDEIEVFEKVGQEDLRYEFGVAPLKKVDPEAAASSKNRLCSYLGRVEFFEQIVLRLSLNPRITKANFLEEIYSLYGELEGRKVLGAKRTYTEGEQLRVVFDERGDAGLLAAREADFAKCFDVWLYLKAHFSPEVWKAELAKVPNLSIDGLATLLRKVDSLANKIKSFGFAADYPSALVAAWNELLPRAVWGDKTFRDEKYLVGERQGLMADKFVVEIDPSLSFVSFVSGTSAEELEAKADASVGDQERKWLGDGQLSVRQRRYYEMHRNRERKSGDEIFNAVLESRLGDEAVLAQIQAKFTDALISAYALLFKDLLPEEKIEVVLKGDNKMSAEVIKRILGTPLQISTMRQELENTQPSEDQILGFSEHELEKTLRLPGDIQESVDAVAINKILDRLYGSVAVEGKVEEVAAGVGEVLGE